MGISPLMLAGFALSAVGTIAQMNYQKAAAQQQQRLALQEAEAAKAAADRVRDSAIAALSDQQEDTRELGEQKKSDAARQADRENAELVAIMSERGQLTTTSLFRQTQQLYYFNELDLARIDRDVNDRVDRLQEEKEQVVENQTQVHNNASLAVYSANVNAKLANQQAKQSAFFSIGSSAVNIGTQYYQQKTQQQIASGTG